MKYQNEKLTYDCKYMSERYYHGVFKNYKKKIVFSKFTWTSLTWLYLQSTSTNILDCRRDKSN